MTYKKLLPAFFIIVLIIFFTTIIIFKEKDETQKCEFDIFKSQPKGLFPNCGPEYRINLNKTINSKEEFLHLLKEYQGSEQYLNFDNFKSNSSIDWPKVYNSIEVCIWDNSTIYSFEYIPDECQTYSFIANSNGMLSVYGCCGK